MSKQNEFNLDMEKYLEKPTKNNSIQKSKPMKSEISVNDLIPDIDEDPTKIHVIEKDSKAKTMLKQYKKKILSILKKEEKEIENINIDESGNVSQEIEDIEEEIEKDTKEAISFSERFKDFFKNMFSSKKIDEEEYEEKPEVQKSLDEINEENIEEEIEEEKIEEELAEKKKFSSWIKSIFGTNQQPQEETEEQPKINKLVLYKAKLDNDTKLALMIADKYLKHLPTRTMDEFEKSGDRKVFLDTLKKLKIR